MEKLVIDASVAVDLFAGREGLRVVSAEMVFGCVAVGYWCLCSPPIPS